MTIHVFMTVHVYVTPSAHRDQGHNSQLNVCLQHAYIGYISKYVKPHSSIMSTYVSHTFVQVYYNTCIYMYYNTCFIGENELVNMSSP